MPKISVVMPTRNRAAFIERAIRSVQAQTFQDWELLVLDDGSTDATPETVRELAAADARICYHRVSANGCSRVRAQGLNLARGEYMGFLDDDDEYEPEMLAREAAYLDANPGVDLVCSSVVIYDEAADTKEVWPKDPHLTFEKMVFGNTVQICTVLARRASLQRAGGFCVALESCDDYMMWLSVARIGKLAFLPGPPVAVYHLHADSMSRNVSRRFWSTMKIFSILRKQELTEGQREALGRAAALFAYKRAWDACRNGLPADAVKRMAAGIRMNPALGLLLPWSRYSNIFYKFFKPYLLVLYFLLKWAGSKAGLLTLESSNAAV